MLRARLDHGPSSSECYRTSYYYYHTLEIRPHRADYSFGSVPKCSIAFALKLFNINPANVKQRRMQLYDIANTQYRPNSVQTDRFALAPY